MREASTVVLLREPEAPAAGDLPGDGAERGPAHGPFEVLLVRRHRASAFMGGAHVFPGGKLDVADSSAELLARTDPTARRRCAEALEPTPGQPLTSETAAGLYVAACRETFEEAGVLLARRSSGEPFVPTAAQRQALDPARRALHAGERSLQSVLEEHELQLDLDALAYIDHWVTPSFEQRRFDARFFLARLPQGQVAAHDSVELTEQAWRAPAAALRAYEAGDIYMAPPTVIVLDELCACESIDAAFRLPAGRTVAAILPKVVADGEAVAILMPWDAAYAGADGEALPGLPGPEHPRAGPIERVSFDGGRWFSCRRDAR